MNLFENYQLPKKSGPNDKRASIIKELYKYYCDDKLSRKKANWKRYVKYLKSVGRPSSQVEMDKFRKSKLFIKEHNISTFCARISHIKDKEDLYLMVSEAKDRKHRGHDVSGYIAGHFSK